MKALLPEGVTATILADRGFGDVKLFEFLDTLGFQYVIRFRSKTHVRAADGEPREAGDWPGKGGRARKLRDAEISAARQKVGAAVCVNALGMKEAWHLAASDGALSAAQIIKLYSKRWTIEPSFRDSKDLRFGMGMSTLRIDDPQRRDRLLMLNAFAIMLLTLLVGCWRKPRNGTANCEPAPPNDAFIPCSDKDAFSTTSSPTCRTIDSSPSSSDIRSSYAKVECFQRLSGSCKMRGTLRLQFGHAN